MDAENIFVTGFTALIFGALLLPVLALLAGVSLRLFQKARG